VLGRDPLNEGVDTVQVGEIEYDLAQAFSASPARDAMLMPTMPMDCYR